MSGNNFANLCKWFISKLLQQPQSLSITVARGVKQQIWQCRDYVFERALTQYIVYL
jgi:hypothetical protein